MLFILSILSVDFAQYIYYIKHKALVEPNFLAKYVFGTSGARDEWIFMEGPI